MDISTRTKVVVAAVGLAAGVGIGVGIASAGGSDDSEGPIQGEELDRASAAALEETGGGEVTETEVGDEDSFYEVEVTLDDGSQVDVQLDRDFNVVGSSTDHEDDEGEGGEDD